MIVIKVIFLVQHALLSSGDTIRKLTQIHRHWVWF